MVHVGALPGTPKGALSVQQLVEAACQEAQTYCRHGVDGLLIENMFDLPYVKVGDAGPEVTAVMSRVAVEVRRVTPPGMPLGVQILAGQNREALAVALAANLQFIRAEGFIFGHLADEGLMDACAGPLLRYRKQVGAEEVAILTDIKKKHASHSLTGDLSIVDTAKAAAFFLSDGLILTGKETGHSADLEEVIQVRRALPDAPLIVGSGVTEENVGHFAKGGVNGAIVGSHFKVEGRWQNELCPERVARFMDKFRSCI